MGKKIKVVLFLTVSLVAALGRFGPPANGERALAWASLHVFLFNLTAGGLLVTTYLAGEKDVGLRGAIFFMLGLLFAAASFFHLPWLNVAAALGLAGIAESVRWQRFSWFPIAFFQKRPVSEKFEQAALLCLSLGLIICAGTVLNNEVLKLFYLEKLSLHVFFLGFSFPISLATFAAIFKRLEQKTNLPRALAEYCFWSLNLGVIAFFFFIIFKVYSLQLATALVLFSMIGVTMDYHLKSGWGDAEGQFLLSALIFLTLGSLTGIGYILELWQYPERGPGYLLSLHSAATLFGWNLGWMLMVLGGTGENARVSPRIMMALHWAFVLGLPLGRLSPVMAGLDLAVLLTLLGLAFFPRPAAASGARA